MSELTERVAGLAARVTDPVDSAILTDVLAALIPIDDVAGTPVDPIVSVLSDMAVSMRLVVANTGHASETITEDLVVAKWNEIVPLRGMYSDMAVGYVRSLGIPVERSS